MQQAFEDTLNELQWMGREESVKHLTQLKKAFKKS